MLARVAVVYLVGVLGLAAPARDGVADSASPVHIIKPPVRCPEGMKPDANGRCRVVWEKSVDTACSAGQEPDGDGLCRQMAATVDCFGEDCPKVKRVAKREDTLSEYEEQTAAFSQAKRQARMEALQSQKRSKKRSASEKGRAGKQERSKHAFLMMLKKKKMQMMKPKPPPPPPPPHHPPHHHPPHHEESEEPPEEQPAEEETPAPERLFFGDEACIETGNSTGGCPGDAEMVENVEANDFKEWKPEKSSESSESSDSSSSSSDSAGESDSVGASGESEDEVLQKAIKIKLMKLFRMKQRYGPALRRWLVTQLREYEDSFDY